MRASARPIAVGRVLFGVGLMLASIEGAALLADLQNGRITTPVASWLPAAADVPVGPWLAVMMAASLCLLLGLFAAPSVAVLGLGHLLLLLTDQQLYSNHRFVLVLLCAWFLFARSDQAFAVGAKRRRERGSVPWWPQLLIVATLSACYLFAGLSKANPEFLTGHLIASMSPSWVPAKLAAWATVPTEISIGLGLWWAPTRRLVLALGVGLHLAIIVLLGSPLVFAAFAALCLSGYPLVWTLPALGPGHIASNEVSPQETMSSR